MAFDFPTGVPPGTIYPGPGGFIYSWDGEKWMKGGSGAGVAAGYVLKAGDTMGGFLTANADPTAPLHYATKQYVDQLVAGGTLGTPGEAHVINTAGQPEWGAPIEAGNF